jgi:hypothetical protein
MAIIVMELLLQGEGSESFMMALYNIQSSCNGGLESALQAMKLMGVNFGILLEAKLMEGVYMHWSSIYTVQSTHALSAWQGGISLFRGLVKRTRLRRWSCVGPMCCRFSLSWVHEMPTDLTTLPHI